MKQQYIKTTIKIIIILLITYQTTKFYSTRILEQHKLINQQQQEQQSNLSQKLQQQTKQEQQDIKTKTNPILNPNQIKEEQIEEQKMSNRLPSVFISHGLVGETLNPSTPLFKCLKKYSQDNKLKSRVKTAIIISGHWEENNVTVNLNPTPKIIHDHPSEWLYKFNFRFETDLDLANKIKSKLEENKITTKTTKTEEVDHGGWGGLFSLFDINEQQKLYDAKKEQYVCKIVQVSLHSGMDTQYHYKIGQVLDQFRNDDVMIIASGASTHSFTYMRHPQFTGWSKDWEKWLISVVTNNNEKERKEELFNVKNHQMYKYMHHSDDHFMPLLVSLGTSPNPGKLICLEQQMTFMCSCFEFM